MISYGKQSIDKSDIDAVVEVLQSDWLTQGPTVELFENDLKTYFGADHCCVVSNGTAALHLTGLALGWKPGDIVITSPITFLASANCIIYAGATPDFVDIDPCSYTIDPNRLEQKIKDYHGKGKRIKAVVAIDFAGHPCDWEALRTIADQYELKLVNDNCHALGARYNGDIQYAVKYADVVTQSFHPVKNITTGEGGAVLTKDAHIDEKIRLLRSHGMAKSPDFIDNKDEQWYYEMHEVGFNYRITDIQCALGISQLKKLDDFVVKRGKIAERYDEVFGSDKRFIIPAVSDTVDHAYHLYPLKIEFEKLNIEKVLFFFKMTGKGMNLQVHYIPVHMQPYYQERFGFGKGNFPLAENYYQNEFSIPIYPALNNANIEKIIEDITSYVNSH
jgi:UDP-4-amino-4,6-dideoxy-N-acetyl-beta-L-altrosamine transaminase